jgi:hypothetical protein
MRVALLPLGQICFSFGCCLPLLVFACFQASHVIPLSAIKIPFFARLPASCIILLSISIVPGPWDPMVGYLRGVGIYV